ncbi:cysteine and histidine-rich domain-containing protein RAR1-like isoform X3 [Triticum dicoccoides]|uniref:cysteine and histidine-rich domain-containing protein RAR1-like isoform X3 n=1 Tax=Triticum dicoccoides TaxID=85692 RepID=UPI00188DE1C4|nr:cysteine and histidine-rich domain-containing protein RAR1-like isoform X3 [Triticum dicoccoides]
MSAETEKSAAAPAPAPMRCQRIGCDAMFTDDDNPDGSCHYHPSGPMFHDGMKEWSCCKQRSHDFSLFLAIPGCATGKHTTEKPVTKAVSLNSKATPPKLAPVQSSKQGVETEACSRCRQGFFCSDHGSQPKAQKPVAVNGTNTEPVEKCSVPQPKKKWKCCDVHVKEFDEFMEIPPCTKGWHNADAV